MKKSTFKQLPVGAIFCQLGNISFMKIQPTDSNGIEVNAVSVSKVWLTGYLFQFKPEEIIFSK